MACALLAVYLIANFAPLLEPAARFVLPLAAGYGAVTWAYHWPRRLAGYDEWVYGSYGLYIWGMPLQQLVVLAGVRDPWLLMALAVPLSYVAGFLSWQLVEMPTQSLRRYLRPPAKPRPVSGHRTMRPVAVERMPEQQMWQRWRFSGDLRDTEIR
ncbi:hypothetical protein SAMN04488074_107240 [Lentzea albidocapillata subsp. violacea]|uniref:Acyltransferase family protein n=1 Tax=Lentzea albidocapillata subsp. violacea TaxID=128104 RepID=A0A1G9F3G2_9PSEU|nr:hypothetical protein [Lentzea albidocapillata]SDK82835.1 hypothetical protein SAMN04488074_107240 [Lentzea albidocapillata subsp. violacea]